MERSCADWIRDVDLIVIQVREEHTKFPRLLELLGKYFDEGQVLIFVERQEDCDSLFREVCGSIVTTKRI